MIKRVSDFSLSIAPMRFDRLNAHPETGKCLRHQMLNLDPSVPFLGWEMQLSTCIVFDQQLPTFEHFEHQKVGNFSAELSLFTILMLLLLLMSISLKFLLSMLCVLNFWLDNVKKCTKINLPRIWFYCRRQRKRWRICYSSLANF